jgi:hypothetical protein
VAPKKKPAWQLKLSQPRAGRLAQRIAEEGGIPGGATSPRPERIAEFQERIRWSARTFSERLLPGEPLMLEFGGVDYNWREFGSFTLAHKFAARHREQPGCAEFLEDLDSDTPQFFMDPTATEAIGSHWFTAFHDSVNWELTAEEVFTLTKIIGWKKPDGLPRYPESFWESHRFRNVLAAGFKAARIATKKQEKSK